MPTRPFRARQSRWLWSAPSGSTFGRPSAQGRAVGLSLFASLAVGAALLATTPAPAPATTPSRTVSIYVPRGASASCTRVLPLPRRVSGPALLTAAMRALLAGPTRSERALGYAGWFSAKTTGHLRSVRLHDGLARVDFRSFARDIPGASSACGGAVLLAQLDRTAKLLANVKRPIYSFDGSTQAFYEWLQLETPRP